MTFTEEMLGTKPADPSIFESYIASKHPKGSPERDELESAERSEIAGTTGFHRDPSGKPIIMNYQMKGYFKESSKFKKQCPGSFSSYLTGYKTVIDGLIYVDPRMILLQIPNGQGIGICERSLRAETPQGPRVALARSETVPAGTIMEFAIRSHVEKLKIKAGSKKLQIPVESFIKEWLSYGQDHGFGQWRNSGKGAFTYEILEVSSVDDGLPGLEIADDGDDEKE